MSETIPEPIQPTMAQVAANNASPAPTDPLAQDMASLESRLASLESDLATANVVINKLQPLVPIVETIVTLADPAAGAAVATAVGAASKVGGVLEDVLVSLNAHFGKDVTLPKPGATKAS